MRIVIGAPGNGAALKEELKSFLEADDRVSEVIDLSTPDITYPDVTYPDVSFRAGQAIIEGRADRGLLVCGIGTAIAASKVPGVRAATAHQLETVRGAVENYDAQILCMGQNVIAPIAATGLLDAWLDYRHDPQGSYAPRLVEISEYESFL